MQTPAPIDVWKRKLIDLEVALASSANAAEKFQLKEQIAEANASIAKLQTGQTGPALSYTTHFGEAKPPQGGPSDCPGDQPVGPRIARTRLPLRHLTDLLEGRERDFARLDKAWNGAENANIITIVAWAGVGKTSLVVHWKNKLFARPNHGGVERYFDWSFYDHGERHEGDATGASYAGSTDLFLKTALEFFGDPILAVSDAGALQKGERLAQLIGEHRNLLILDGIEPFQEPKTGDLRNEGLRALLCGLAARNLGLCLVTTRQHISDLNTWNKTSSAEWRLSQLTKKAGCALLSKLGVKGTNKEKRELSAKVKGHALTLMLIGNYLRKAHHGDIRRADQVDFLKSDKSEQGGHAFHVIAAYERWFKESNHEPELAILRMLGLFDRPANVGHLFALRQLPVIPSLSESLIDLGEDNWNIALSNLVTCGLVSRVGANLLESGLDTHPLIRHYFAYTLRRDFPDAWQMAHQRLYIHLPTLVPYQPDNIVALEVLYQSVTHGCLAGHHSAALHDLFLPRIQRGHTFFSTYVLAAYDSEIVALRSYFAPGWKISELLTDEDKSIVLTRTGYCLRALGRLTEAASVLAHAVAVQQRLNRFKDASISAGILGHVWMNIGRFDEARKVVLEAVCFAKRCQDCLQLVTKLSILSQIYHYMGQNGRAFAAYKCGMQKQERMPMIRDDPEFPVLNCLSVYNYSELLLSLKMVETLSVHVHNALDILSQSRDKAHTLANALMRLTLGRISMVQGNFEEAELHLNSAVDQFKAAGRGDDRARVLLARADVSRANLNFDRWEADLLLALDAANRCEAGTCQADCHLAMAWLRLQQKRQKLAVRHYRYAVSMCVHGTSGYHRKDAEIVELKAALKDST